MFEFAPRLAFDNASGSENHPPPFFGCPFSPSCLRARLSFSLVAIGVLLHGNLDLIINLNRKFINFTHLKSILYSPILKCSLLSITNISPCPSSASCFSSFSSSPSLAVASCISCRSSSPPPSRPPSNPRCAIPSSAHLSKCSSCPPDSPLFSRSLPKPSCCSFRCFADRLG